MRRPVLMKESIKEKYDRLEEDFDKLQYDYNCLLNEKECLENQILQLESVCLSSGIKIPYKDDLEISF